MQSVIERLKSDKDKIEASIKVNDDAIAQHELAVASIVAENEKLEDEADALDGAISALERRSVRKPRRRKK